MVAGVMSAPALGERWYATRGGGAWAVGAIGPSAGSPRRIDVSGVGAIADAQVLYASPLDIEASGQAPGFDALVRSAWRDRGFGDFWGYALVAEGAAEAMVEVGPNSWDLAAPSIVVEEAGGRMTDLHGVAVGPQRDGARDERPPPRRGRASARGLGRAVGRRLVWRGRSPLAGQGSQDRKAGGERQEPDSDAEDHGHDHADDDEARPGRRARSVHGPRRPEASRTSPANRASARRSCRSIRRSSRAGCRWSPRRRGPRRPPPSRPPRTRRRPRRGPPSA